MKPDYPTRPRQYPGKVASSLTWHCAELGEQLGKIQQAKADRRKADELAPSSFLAGTRAFKVEEWARKKQQPRRSLRGFLWRRERMRLHTVTITGSDDQTDPAHLAGLSTEFPFVEWGVLLTSRSGRPLFPSGAWVDRLRQQAAEGMRLSGHVCSSWAKQVCAGQWPAKLRLERFARVQLNIGRYLAEVASPEALARCLPRGPEYILQVGTSRKRGLALAYRLRELGVAASVLFDASGGKGISPEAWPSVPEALRCGFAGGLAPDNLARQLRSLEGIVGDGVVWIDMQSGVRSPDGAQLDLGKVRECLEVSSPYAQIPMSL